MILFFLSLNKKLSTSIKSKQNKKYSTKHLKKAAVAIVFLIFVSCATSTAGLVTSNTAIGDRKFTIVGPVKDKISWYTLDIGFIGLPLEEPPIEEFTQNLITQNNADALINIRYWNEKSVFLFVTKNTFGLNAEAIKWEEIPVVTNPKTKK
ncbi:MAG: hypothetical protein O9346_04355 [Leptospiraceae bacterium]|nr:hypothetical protein [Leptospiraceae bacterium]MCZ8345628.1 hypothetical protein [Leptospiraceae bacterium]